MIISFTNVAMDGSHKLSYSYKNGIFMEKSQTRECMRGSVCLKSKTVWGKKTSTSPRKTCIGVVGTTIDENGNIKTDEEFFETVLVLGATDEKFQICQELYNTERHYIDNLKLLLMVKDALIERVEKEKPIISRPKIVQIFGKIQPIVDLHEEISQKLADLIDNYSEKQCDVAKIWVDANNELLRVYPSYINYCDNARSLLIDACERHPRLRTFIEEQEKLPEFHRQRAIDIMTFPVQRLAGVKLLLEKLEKKSNNESTELQHAIQSVGNVLRRSNSVRRENDVHIAQLNLLQEVESIPCELVYSSHVLVGTVEVQLLCTTNKIKLGNKDPVLKLTLFSDGVILVCSCRKYKLINWMAKTRATSTLCKLWKKPYKYLTTLRAEQFRCMMFIHCTPNKDDLNRSKRSPICCWKIRERMGDIEWFVAVENHEDMQDFGSSVEVMINGRIVRKDKQEYYEMNPSVSMRRSLNMHVEMKFREVPSECRNVLRKYLESRKFFVPEDDESEISAIEKRPRDGLRALASRKSGFRGLFNGISNTTKSMERVKGSKGYRRRTIEPCELFFAPIAEEN
ncbi:hypothetical protein RB195_019518 [Necator americanus]